ncbi:hypothetical protein [Streptomyces sp. NPDC003832]
MRHQAAYDARFFTEDGTDNHVHICLPAFWAAQEHASSVAARVHSEEWYQTVVSAYDRLISSGAYREPIAKGETDMMAGRNDITTPEGAQVIEEIDANIERAVSLAEAENSEGLKELNEATETLIASLAGKGSIAVKKEKRDALNAASQAQPKAEPPAKVHEGVVVPRSYDSYEGVSELIDMGAERMSEGVKLNLRVSDVAKEIADVALNIVLRIPNKDGDPDIMLTSQQSRDAMGALLRKAGEGVERNYHTEKALKSLQRSVQYYRADARAKYLTSLDESSEDADDERDRFVGVLEGKPDDVSASVWVAKHYGASLKGDEQVELEAWNAKQAALESGDQPASTKKPDVQPSADEKVRDAVKRFRRDASKVDVSDFQNASEETKAEIRAELSAVYEEIKAMLTAAL